MKLKSTKVKELEDQLESLRAEVKSIKNDLFLHTHKPKFKPFDEVIYYHAVYGRIAESEAIIVTDAISENSVFIYSIKVGNVIFECNECELSERVSL